MADECLIEASGVSLAYRMAREPTQSVREFAIRRLKRQIQYEDFWALRDVSFALHRGSVLAVVGANGAGKSTLMKVVARVLAPTHGRIVVRGQVSPLIELGVGFHPDLTGLENLVLYGTILGHDPAELRCCAGEIAAWAEVQDFMDVPIRSYSSGMRARLGFAVATWAAPDILVVDEVLSVGDERFRKRSVRRIKELLDLGTAVLFVSHSMERVRELADTALWLDHGRAVEFGAANDVADAYLAAQEDQPPAPTLAEAS